MNRQYAFDPPPTPGRSDYQSRRQGIDWPASINTTLPPTHGTHLEFSSPVSALSGPFTPILPSSPSFAPGTTSLTIMASQPYNPSQWSHSGPVSGSYMPFTQSSQTTVGTTGMEAALPSPPPPYTSPQPEDMSRSLRDSPTLHDTAFASSSQPTSRAPSGSTSLHSSPQVYSTPHFPPPPPRPQESGLPGSTRRKQRSVLSLSALVPKVRSPDARDSSQDMHPPDHPGLGIRAPAARRAVSASAIDQARVNSWSNQNDEDSALANALRQLESPLPPPPPGPPPSTRSQSLGRSNAHPPGTSSSYAKGTRLPSSFRHIDSLDPIPPTPADWVDEERTVVREASGHVPDRVDSIVNNDDPPRSINLTRRPATREASAKGIRERRSRSRVFREGIDAEYCVLEGPQVSNSATRHGPTDLVLPAKAAATKDKASQSDCSPQLPDSSNSVLANSGLSNSLSILTPPYTPAGHVVVTPTTVPTQKTLQPSTPSSQQPRTKDNHRVQYKPCEPHQTTGREDHRQQESFGRSSLSRYSHFIKQETAAETDQDRLELFARFVVSESRLRRGRYSTAFDTMAIDIIDLTRDMWRAPSPSSATPRSGKSLLPLQKKPPASSPDGGTSSPEYAPPSSGPSLAELTPVTEFESMDGSMDLQRSEIDLLPWGEKFQPCLSPIPSMAVSSVPEENSSRGRSASRWWEGSAEGSIGASGHRLERSARESKYMSLHPSELQATTEPSSAMDTPIACGIVPNFPQRSRDYPPEKMDSYQEATTASAGLATPSSVQSPGFNRHFRLLREERAPPLDVSRLVTLPPPYPRHYPAVNNNHPILEDLRKRQRDLADLELVRSIKQAYENTETERRQTFETSRKERRQAFRARLESDVSRGFMTYSAAALAEAAFEDQETERATAEAQDAYLRLHSTVSEPGRRRLEEKLEGSEECINMMLMALSNHESSGTSTSPQIEGDEEPELLEHLTLLKWLFEGREQLHKELFDLQLLEKRSSQVVAASHMHMQSSADLEFENQLFGEDVYHMQINFAEQAHARYTMLQDTVEKHVARGVEAQISAFWDIAPALLEVVHKIPTTSSDLNGFQVLVPTREVEENPSYGCHSLQYLVCTLSHAKKSAYQFIESQINLLCLLHEVQTAAMAASARMVEIQQRGEVVGDEAVGIGMLEREMRDVRRQQERLLTEELKGKVGEVERGWEEALGGAIKLSLCRVKAFLCETGAWEEGLEE